MAKVAGTRGAPTHPKNVNEQLHNPGVFVYVSTMFLRFWYVCSHTVFGIRGVGGGLGGSGRHDLISNFSEYVRLRNDILPPHLCVGSLATPPIACHSHFRFVLGMGGGGGGGGWAVVTLRAPFNMMLLLPGRIMQSLIRSEAKHIHNNVGNTFYTYFHRL